VGALGWRDFLRAAGATAGGIALGGRRALAELAPRRRAGPRSGSQGRLLDTHPSDSPIDTVVVMMMENRSFDHYLGWMGTDEPYLERGSSRWGVPGRRDRFAHNLGASLGATHPDPELGYDPDLEIGPYSAACPPGELVNVPPAPEGEHPDPFVLHEELEDLLARNYPATEHRPWLDVPV
jgi:hypothetical protein